MRRNVLILVRLVRWPALILSLILTLGARARIPPPADHLVATRLTVKFQGA